MFVCDVIKEKTAKISNLEYNALSFWKKKVRHMFLIYLQIRSNDEQTYYLQVTRALESHETFMILHY